MIWESRPWREELCRVADRLNEWRRVVDWDDELVAFEIERDVMVSAYAIRKLLEARKLSDSAAESKFRVEAFPLIDRIPDHMNWHRLDEFYNFERSSSEDLTLEQLCNQLIHSFIFVRIGDADGDDETGYEGGLAGFFVASDRARSSRLYRISIDSLVSLLQSVGTEEVVATKMIRDASGQWQVSNMTAADMNLVEPGSRDHARQNGPRPAEGR